MMQLIHRCWRVLRTLVGDDAYERYCEHHQHCHTHAPTLDRRSFYLQYQQEKWNGIKRCC